MHVVVIKMDNSKIYIGVFLYEATGDREYPCYLAEIFFAGI
jgi:hypothetical protein